MAERDCAMIALWKLTVTAFVDGRFEDATDYEARLSFIESMTNAEYVAFHTCLMVEAVS